MGAQTSTAHEENDSEITLDDFKIYRTIGKGTFGKVCVVKKLNTKRLFALKYIPKERFLEGDLFNNISREVDILADLHHPFLVNLWFSFQDDAYIFLVFDLLLGGDLRYHLNQRKKFALEEVTIYLYEIAFALDYLRSKRVLHRDVKPDNLLLNDTGHVHLTDFNIATVINENSLATAISGTKPYMAPEIFGSSIRACHGYSFSVDWWSLGICCYELLAGVRPYDIRTDTQNQDCYKILTQTMIPVPLGVNEEFMQILGGLLSIRSEQRIGCLNDLRLKVSHVDFKEVLHKQVQPVFVPSEEKLNCDPTYELEETIIEDNPLQKRRHKARRLSKQSSVSRRGADISKASFTDNHLASPEEDLMEKISREFSIYNREKLLKDEAERIEKLEEELGLRPCPEDDAISKRLGTQTAPTK